MEFLRTQREIIEAGSLLGGAGIAGIGLIWLLLTAVRFARTRGPLVLAILGLLLGATPFVLHAMQPRLPQLDAAVDFLDSTISGHVAKPDGTTLSGTQFQMQTAVAVAGACMVATAFLWLAGRGMAQGRRAGWPSGLLIFGLLLIVLPFIANLLLPHSIDLGPRQKEVDGHVHLTLTGWDRQDYGILRQKPDTYLLQMANPNVDDNVLSDLKGMTRLHELDVSDSSITDDGLAHLTDLPLEVMRVARTKITDAGFKEHVAGIATLKMLDVSGTAISAETIADWKKAKPGRKALR